MSQEFEPLATSAAADPQLQRLLQSAAGDEPCAADLQAVHTQLHAQIALAAASTAGAAHTANAIGAATQAAHPAGFVLGAGAKWGIGIAAALVIGGGALRWANSANPAAASSAPSSLQAALDPSPALPAPTLIPLVSTLNTPAAAAPNPLEATAHATAAAKAEMAVPVAPVKELAAPRASVLASVASSAAPVVATAPAEPAESEAHLVGRSQQALAAGDFALVSTLVRLHEQKYPQGNLTEEREFIAAEAEWRSGQTQAARARARAFRARYPHSVHLERVNAWGLE